jgi:hypothetical protein
MLSTCDRAAGVETTRVHRDRIALDDPISLDIAVHDLQVD